MKTSAVVCVKHQNNSSSENSSVSNETNLRVDGVLYDGFDPSLYQWLLCSLSHPHFP